MRPRQAEESSEERDSKIAIRARTYAYMGENSGQLGIRTSSRNGKWQSHFS